MAIYPETVPAWGLGKQNRSFETGHTAKDRGDRSAEPWTMQRPARQGNVRGAVKADFVSGTTRPANAFDAGRPKVESCLG